MEVSFEDYLLKKRIDQDRFKQEDPSQWESLKKLFDQVHPNSFTVQKLYLINPIRRKYPLKEDLSTAASKTSTAEKPKPVMKTAVKPETGGQPAAKPVMAKPGGAKPKMAKPVVAKPKMAKPVVAKPKKDEPEDTEPKKAKPVIAKPKMARPVIKKPKTDQ